MLFLIVILFLSNEFNHHEPRKYQIDQIVSILERDSLINPEEYYFIPKTERNHVDPKKIEVYLNSNNLSYDTEELVFDKSPWTDKECKNYFIPAPDAYQKKFNDKRKKQVHVSEVYIVNEISFIEVVLKYPGLILGHVLFGFNANRELVCYEKSKFFIR